MFGEQLKSYRMKNGYSQKRMAEILGVSSRTIIRWEQNCTEPDQEEIKRISSKLNLNEGRFLFDEDRSVSFVSSLSNSKDLARINDNINNLISRQDALSETIASYCSEQANIIRELKDQNQKLMDKLEEQAAVISSCEIALDMNEFGKGRKKAHKKALAICGSVAAAVILLVGGVVLNKNVSMGNKEDEASNMSLYEFKQILNNGYTGEIIEGPIIMGTPTYFEIDDGM